MQYILDHLDNRLVFQFLKVPKLISILQTIMQSYVNNAKAEREL